IPALLHLVRTASSAPASKPWEALRQTRPPPRPLLPSEALREPRPAAPPLLAPSLSNPRGEIFLPPPNTISRRPHFAPTFRNTSPIRTPPSRPASFDKDSKVVPQDLCWCARVGFGR